MDLINFFSISKNNHIKLFPEFIEALLALFNYFSYSNVYIYIYKNVLLFLKKEILF